MRIAGFSSNVNKTQKTLSNIRFGTDSEKTQSKKGKASAPADNSYKLSHVEYLRIQEIQKEGKLDYSDYLKSQGLKTAPLYEGEGYGNNQYWPNWDWVAPSEKKK